ncbi:hypothetical protein [Endozoicomonas ascidiicola]|uniref:hypothetical protein n=1 Tax=Endozoicomonas ascidiicola TaxID=1698521 RepID=UPI000836A102|nr:hypothetical protein [Endozoicomonas ascidiicola]
MSQRERFLKEKLQSALFSLEQASVSLKDAGYSKLAEDLEVTSHKIKTQLNHLHHIETGKE